jgi:hypothetical protein
MSRTTPATRRSAVPSGAPTELLPCSRIDLQPSPRAAILAGGWLFLVCAAVLASVALPLLARIGICVAIATPAVAAVRSVVLLLGARAVRGLQWSGGWTACLGPDRVWTPVTLRAGSFRIGDAFLLLWVESCHGKHQVFIDAGRQDPGAIRRLCRELIASNPKV